MTASSSSATGSITLRTPEGEEVSLSDYAGHPLVVILVRYYGCLPCQTYVMEIDKELDRFPAGTKVIAVGGSADYQAQWLKDTQGISMPVLLDPDQLVRKAAELGNIGLRNLLSIRGGKNYLRSMKSGLRPKKITKDTVRSPGVAVFDENFELTWSYEGEFLGDYPSIEQLLERL